MALDILMYHAVADGAGPTFIAPRVFAAQMQALAASGLPVVSLDAVAAARRGGAALPPRAVVLTFDDGFRDFADTAWPLIRAEGWPVTVYLPTGHVGAVETWRGQATPPRPLMGWPEIVRLAAEGVDFGGHSVRHPDLTALAAPDRAAEIEGCTTAIARHLGAPPRHFAPPYGLADAALRRMIADHGYHTACGTRLGQAGAGDDPFDLPRIEMYYFTDIARWRRHLAGRGGAYLALRRGLRRLRSMARDPWEKD